MVLRDLHDIEDPTVWAGLAIHVEQPTRPRFRVEYARSGFLRLTLDGRPLLWVRWHGGFDGFSWLRAPFAGSVMPPFSSMEARGVTGTGPGWARFFLPRLVDAGVLSAGDWCLHAAHDVGNLRLTAPQVVDWSGSRASAFGVREARRALSPAVADRWDWDFDGGNWLLALRPPSPPDSARVKAWRKVAREGRLPPLVIYFVALLDSWVLLDGHDRLHAAVLEGVQPPMLSLTTRTEVSVPVDEEARQRLYKVLENRFGEAGSLPASTQRSLESVFLSKFHPPRFERFRTRAWRLPGGRETWHSEVTEAMKSVAIPSECWLLS